MGGDVAHTVYRVTRSKRAGDLSGEGSRRVGGRWNSVGIPALYTSDSIPLALLEVLVHLQLLNTFPGDYQVTVLDLLEIIPYPTERLPKDPPQTTAYGDAMLKDAEVLGFWVPSVIVARDFNLVLNPTCPRFGAAVRVREIVDQPLDPRLVASAKPGGNS